MATGKTIGEMSVDCRFLYQRLVKAEEGDTVDYSELSSIIGRDVQGNARTVLYSARRIAEREGLIFDAIRGVGLKRLPNGQIASTVSASTTSRIRRAARRGMRRVGAVEYDRLTKSEQVDYNVSASMLSAFASMATEKSTRIVRTHAEKDHKALPLADFLRAMSE